MGSGARIPTMKTKQDWLFPPIAYRKGHISCMDGKFRNKFKKWVINNGEVNKKLKLTTTWGLDSEPHEVDWIAEVLEHISPIHTFENSWGQLYGSGGFHPSHNHISDDNVLSGCLYFNDGPGTMFQDPLMPSRHVVKGVLPGDFLLWDPNLYHCSPPHDSGRLILAFNLNSYDPNA